MTGATKYPNFDHLRLAAASCVVFSHSFFIAEGGEQNEPLVKLLGPGNIAGFYAVFVFFIISGFLVSQSAATTATTPRFLWKRFLRIYPALFVCCFISALILGPFFREVGLRTYFLRMDPYTYI